MFGSLTEKLTNVFSKFLDKKNLSETNISDAVREVRLALLDADVHYNVAKNFINRVKEKVLGEQVIKSVSPGQQFVKIIHEELVALMGGEEAQIHLSGNPTIIMLCGLQGSGKTTHAAKLAKYFKNTSKKKSPLLVACDLQRPAAVEQLKILGAQIDVPVFCIDGEKNPLSVAKEALKFGKSSGSDILIFDTAGRLHIDDVLMRELEQIKDIVKPHEILFVANAATGQDAVNTAEAFDKRLSMTGTILTMLDGDARGGAAISIKEVTGKPLKFEGVGEKLDDLQLFNPSSMADRILGMGDTINLVKKAKEHISEEDAKDLEEKIRTATFTYEDYMNQIKSVRKMGPLKKLLKMMPGASQLPDLEGSEKEFTKIEAIILSMTPRERQIKDELSIPRMKRIALGSGTQFNDVSKLRKSFQQSRQFFKNMPKNKKLEKMMRGM